MITCMIQSDILYYVTHIFQSDTCQKRIQSLLGTHDAYAAKEKLGYNRHLLLLTVMISTVIG